MLIVVLCSISDEEHLRVFEIPLCGGITNEFRMTTTRFSSSRSIDRDMENTLLIFTSCMNFLQTGRMSLLKVAENIITCFP